MHKIKIIECPRDAMQGLKTFVPTEAKAAYINLLLQAGFDTIDFGSFVSPKAIPQMRDTEEVLGLLDLAQTQTHLLAIVANPRGAAQAASFSQITYLGYPFSVSETFQERNTNATIEESLVRVEEIQEICQKQGKSLVLYISMGFGNPYGDPWNVEIVQYWVARLAELDIRIFQLSDTIGVASPQSIRYLFSNLTKAFPQLELGAHFHTLPTQWREKIDAAFESGCRRFDGAVKGYGGCPMARDELTGNMPTEHLVALFRAYGLETGIQFEVFQRVMEEASKVFPN